MFFLFFLNVFCKQIDLTILYEDTTPNILNSQYLNILNNKISILNTKLSTPFNFNIETLNSFEQFCKETDYEYLSYLAGSDSIEGRFNNLNPTKNTLLLIASDLNETIFQKKDTSCFKHILMNRNSQLLEGKDVIFQLEMGLVALILKIMNVDLKNVNGFLMDNLLEILKNSKGFEKLDRKCFNEEGSSQSSDSESAENKNEYSKLVLDNSKSFSKPHIPKINKGKKKKDGGGLQDRFSQRRSLTYPEQNIKRVEDDLLRNRKYVPSKFATDTNFSVGDGSFRRLGLGTGKVGGLSMI